MPISSPIHSAAFREAAGPIIEDRARRVAICFELHPQDRQDLEQELWLYLWLWWSDPTPQARASQPPLWLRQDVVSRVDRLVAILVRTPSFWRGILPDIETTAMRNGDSLSGDPTQEAQRRHELHLDVATVLPRLTEDLRAWCESVLRDGRGASTESACLASCTPDAQLVALRRVFRAHGLHEYL